MASEIGAWLEQPIGSNDDIDDLEPDAPKIYRNETCVPEIWREFMGKDGPVPAREATMIGKAMSMLGWEKTNQQKSIPRLEKFGNRIRVYRRP